MKTVIFFLFIFLVSSCSQVVKKTVVMDAPIKDVLLKCSIVNSRLEYKAKLKKNKDLYIVTSPLCDFRITPVGNKIEITVISKSEARNRQVVAFLAQTKTDRLMEKQNFAPQKNRLGLVGLHLLAPSFSYLYVEDGNPFFKETNPVAKFFLHLGIDGLLTLATGTDFFSSSFKFRPSIAAALFAHRALSLPNFMIQMDYFNRSVRAGYRFKF